MRIIECQNCGWRGLNKELIAPFSGSEPGCPHCGGTDFLDVEDKPHPNINEEDWREER